MARRGKNYRGMVSAIDRTKQYELVPAIELLQKVKFAKFDEAVEVAINLGVNPRHADQMVRGAVVFPHGLGKTVRVAVFAKGEKENEAREAGADFVGGEDLVKKIQSENWLDFDKAMQEALRLDALGLLADAVGQAQAIEAAVLKLHTSWRRLNGLQERLWVESGSSTPHLRELLTALQTLSGNTMRVSLGELAGGKRVRLQLVEEAPDQLEAPPIPVIAQAG
jgi:hypothetical protein